MEDITPQDIDQFRIQGLRPQVIGCFVFDKKILFLYKKEHNLWQLPQGGIDNKEKIDMATTREMTEELGDNFISQCNNNYEIIGEDAIIFPTPKQGSRELIDNSGNKIHMKGKKYFFIAIKANDNKININETEFDDYKWLTCTEAIEITDNMYQAGKKRITNKILKILQQKNLI